LVKTATELTSFLHAFDETADPDMKEGSPDPAKVIQSECPFSSGRGLSTSPRSRRRAYSRPLGHHRGAEPTELADTQFSYTS